MHNYEKYEQYRYDIMHEIFPELYDMIMEVGNELEENYSISFYWNLVDVPSRKFRINKLKELQDKLRSKVTKVDLDRLNRLKKGETR